MSTIIPFTFPETGQPVRTVTIDGDPWFVGKDACDIVGISKYRDALAQLDADERVSAAVDTPGGSQQMILVSEPGIYALMLISRSPKVKPFRRWITHEVIPSIRRTGSYAVPAAPVALPGPRELAQMVIAEADRADAAEARAAQLAPAARSWKILASGEGDFSVADAAKILGRDPSITLGRNRLFALLAEYRWTYRQAADDKPRAMQTAVERGWLSELPQSYEHPRTGELVLAAPQVRVTAKGLHELHKRLGGTGALVEGGVR